jgi:serine/threonine-protein kinase
MMKKGLGANPPEHPCAKCGGSVLPDDKFCANCGTRVERTCPACGVLLLASDRFCPDCGAVLEASVELLDRTSEYASVWDSVLRRLRTHLAGDYRITRELGRGGQAAVFLADELALTRQVAIKVLAPGSISGEGAVERFRREAQLVANLKHAHIVTVYSVRQIEELNLFVMQYVEGRSLAAIIGDCGQLPLGATRAIAFQVGSALQYAHRRQVIHRDIKPANVLFDEDGNAIVTDFGIAKDLSLGSTTHTGLLMGTPAYMSPEQCYQSAITWASDQYSLGIMIYEMLTSRVPFEGSSFAVMQGHTDREPPPIRDYRADCPVELEWAVMRMLAKRPADRWQSFPEAMTALGATPLAGEDPIRDELRRLALTGEESRGRALTPTGPRRRTPTTPAPAPAPVPAPAVQLSVRVPDRLEIGETAKCTAFVLTDGRATPKPLASTWKSTDETVAAFQRDDTLIGVGVGRTTISADTAEGVAEVVLEVVAAAVRSIQLSIAETTLEVGGDARAAATARDARNAVLDASFDWSSSAPSVAVVASDGHIVAKAPGSSRITASAGGISQSALLYVDAAKAASIALTAAPASLAAGESFVLGATVYDRRGQALSNREIRWDTSNRSVAVVDRNGVVTARAAGQVTITARCDDARNSTTLAVTRPVAEAAPEHVAPREPPPVREIEQVTEAPAWSSTLDDAPVRPERAGFRRWAIVGVPVLLLGALGIWQLTGASDTQITPADSVVADNTVDTAAMKDESKSTPAAGAGALPPETGDTVVRLRIDNVPQSLFLTESVVPTLSVSRGGAPFTLVDPVQWTSSDRRVITVDAITGRVATVGAGDASVIARSGAYRTSRRLRVAERQVAKVEPVVQTTDLPKADPPKVDPPRVDPPKADVSKVDPPKADPPKVDPPRLDPPKNEPSPEPAVAVSAADAQAMIATLRGHFTRRDANAIRGLYADEGSADQAKREEFIRELSAAAEVVVLSAQSAPRSDSDAPTQARAAFQLELRSGFVRPRRRNVEVLLVFTRSGAAFQPRGFRLLSAR